jgi:hypothetical protein
MISPTIPETGKWSPFKQSPAKWFGVFTPLQ